MSGSPHGRRWRRGLTSCQDTVPYIPISVICYICYICMYYDTVPCIVALSWNRGSSIERFRQKLPALRTWVHSVPPGDLWSLLHGPFVQTALFQPVLERVAPHRVEREALEQLAAWEHWRSEGEPARQVLERLTGLDCGGLGGKMEPSAREAVETCWFELGVREGVWP